MFYSGKSPYLMKRVDENNNFLPIDYSNKYNLLYTNGSDNIIIMNGFKYDYVGEYPKNLNEVMVSSSLYGKEILSGEGKKVTGVVKDNGYNIYALDGFVTNLKSYKVNGLIPTNKYIFKLNKKIISDINISDTYIKNSKEVKLNSNEAIISRKIDDADKYVGDVITLYIYNDLDVYVDGIDRKADKIFNNIKIVGVGDENVFSFSLLKDYFNYTYMIDGIYLNAKDDVYDFYNKGYISLENYDKNLEIFKNIDDIKTVVIVVFTFLTLLILGLIIYFVPYIIKIKRKNIAILKTLGTSRYDINKIILSEILIFDLNILVFSYLSFKLSLYLFHLNNSFIYLSNSYYAIFIVLVLIFTLAVCLLKKYKNINIRKLLDS